MNLFSMLGLVIASGVIAIGLRLATNNPIMFFDAPSLFIVVGGTLAATAVCFQLNRIAVIFKIFFRRVLGYKDIDYGGIIAELMGIVEMYRNGVSLDDQISKVDDPFIKEALTMLSDGVLEEKHCMRLLRKRCDNMQDLQMEEAKKMKVLSKFPPAFGMMGTTIGMVVLLSNLGGEDAIKMVGPAMSLCLITTLYGLIFSNILLTPAAENLIAATKETHLKNTIIVEGMGLLLKKANPVVVAEELNTYLPPSKRVDWKKILKK